MADLEKRLDQAIKAGDRGDAIKALLAKCERQTQALRRVRAIASDCEADCHCNVRKLVAADIQEILDEIAKVGL